MGNYEIVEVTEVREGQVWENNDFNYTFVIDKKVNDFDFAFTRFLNNNEDFKFHGKWVNTFPPESKDTKLIGALGITHDIVDGRLVEREIEHPAVGFVYEDEIYSHRDGEYADNFIITNINNVSVYVHYEKNTQDSGGYRRKFLRYDKPIGNPATHELKYVEDEKK